ncbi:MAG: energy transducer TonB [Bacteroidia bacterium]|nr:energy transducer TonB [Bacteroidia bacterium]
MKYLETKHERNSAKITVLISLIILLLLFVVGPHYLDPPEEYGVAVNFGNSDFGSGNTPLKQPVKSEINKKIEEPVEQETQSEPQTNVTKAEDVITDETAESIAIKKRKEAEARAKAEADRIERERQEAIERKKREDAQKKKELDALIGGVKNSNSDDGVGEGNDDSAGNKGQLNGDPYAPSYFGGSGPGKGGVGYGLNGRGRPSKQIFKQDCNEYGLVVVRIEVNRQGNVISANPGVRGTTNTDPCLLEPAKKIALSHKWPADSNAPSKQIGFVSINFEISN